MRFAIIALAAVLGLGFAAGSSGSASAKDFKITKQDVKKACSGGQMQGSGNAFGCTKCSSGKCRDYSCNHTGQGRQGCWETVLNRKAPDGRTRGHDFTKTNVTATSNDKRRGRDVKVNTGATSTSGHGAFGKDVQGVSTIGPAKDGDPTPFNRRGGGRSSNNRH
jgi:hypothetical protein